MKVLIWEYKHRVTVYPEGGSQVEEYVDGIGWVLQPASDAYAARMVGIGAKILGSAGTDSKAKLLVARELLIQARVLESGIRYTALCKALEAIDSVT